MTLKQPRIQRAVFYARVGPNFQAARHRRPRHWRPIPGWRDGEQAGTRGRRRSARLDGSWGLGACLCAGELLANIRLPGSTEAEVEALAFQHRFPRMREDFPNHPRIGSAPSSLVPPGTAPCLPTGPTRWKSRQTSKDEGIGCFTSTGGHGRRVARVGLLVRLPRASFHKRRRRRGGHAPSHCHRVRLKLRLYAAIIVYSTLTHGSGAWTLTPRALAGNAQQFQLPETAPAAMGGGIARRPPSLRTTLWRLCWRGGIIG